MPERNATPQSRPHFYSTPPGFTPWRAVGLREYDRANRDGLPTMMIEFRCDDQFQAQHYVANYLPGRPIR